jgi:reverse gyrase
MKSVSVSLDDAEFVELGKLAASKSTTVDGLLQKCARELAFGSGESEAAQRAVARRELVAYVRSMKTGLVVGERPTRERTYARGLFGRPLARARV